MVDFKYQLALKGFFSWVAYYATRKIIPQMAPMFIKSNLFGIDLCKRSRTKKIAESQGVIAGSIYMIVMIVYLPIQFAEIRLKTDELLPNYFIPSNTDNAVYYHTLFMVQIVAGLLSICLMLLLGFADDVLDLRWRTKLLLPTIASLPLLIVYALTYDSTTIIVPKPFRPWLGFSLDLSFIYYIYLSMLAVFCTNAINIVAGINGIEAGQSVMIALSIIAYNSIELFCSTDHWYSHIFSLDMMLPFFGVSMGLLSHNWYPASVFVGDTYCYFAGMTFAVVGILGHFSKTMLLFFLPQVFNFLYSCPQLFHFVDCPRHRLPKYNPTKDCLEPSTFQIDTNKVSTLGALMIKILRILRLVSYRKVSDTVYECSNLTIINLTLVLLGPMRERTVTICLLVLHSLCTVFAFFIRYGLSQVFY